MKLYLNILFITILGVIFFSQPALAADSSNPVTVNGNRLQYNVPYSLRDKNLPNRGAVTFQVWLNHDYAIFGHTAGNVGTPIIFESPTNKTGFIDSEDAIIVRSTQSNWGGWHFWNFTSSWNANSVWFSNRRESIGRIYGLSNDNSIGIGGLGIQAVGGAPFPVFIQLEGGTGSRAWMTANVRWLQQLQFPPLNTRRTPFIISEI